MPRPLANPSLLRSTSLSPPTLLFFQRFDGERNSTTTRKDQRSMEAQVGDQDGASQPLQPLPRLVKPACLVFHGYFPLILNYQLGSSFNLARTCQSRQSPLCTPWLHIIECKLSSLPFFPRYQAVNHGSCFLLTLGSQIPRRYIMDIVQWFHFFDDSCFPGILRQIFLGVSVPVKQLIDKNYKEDKDRMQQLQSPVQLLKKLEHHSC